MTKKISRVTQTLSTVAAAVVMALPLVVGGTASRAFAASATNSSDNSVHITQNGEGPQSATSTNSSSNSTSSTTTNTPVAFPGSPKDCDSNAILYCGALSATELKQKYDAADNNTREVYASYGISSSDINSIASGSANVVAGAVQKNGDVVVNGKVVANNAISAGWHNMKGSTPVTYNGATFYNSAPSISFVANSIDAYVVENQDGQFQYAILASCGNPVKATNVVPAPKPQPKPTYSCDLLQVTPDNESRTVTISNFQTSQTNGATFKDVTINWGNNGDNSNTLTTDTPVGKKSPQYPGNGPFTITATANFMVGDQQKSATSASCAQQVSFTTPTPPASVTPPAPTQPKQLVNTGPASTTTFIGLFIGVSMIATGAHLYFTRRRNLGSF